MNNEIIKYSQRIKLYYQRTISQSLSAIFLTPIFVIIAFYFFDFKFDTAFLLERFYNYITIAALIFLSCILLRLRNLNYLFREDISMTDGKIIKTYHDKRSRDGMPHKY